MLMLNVQCVFDLHGSMLRAVSFFAINTVMKLEDWTVVYTDCAVVQGWMCIS